MSVFIGGGALLLSTFLLVRRSKEIQEIELAKEPRMNVVPKGFLKLKQGGKLFVSQGSVVTMAANVIVNAANTGGLGGGGVDGAISKAGGEELRKAREALPIVGTTPNERRKRHRIRTGGAVITIGGSLNADYCIHAVGPNYRVCMSMGKTVEECDALLYSAYKTSMLLAKEKKFETIGFSLLSAGIFRGTRTVKSVLSIGINALLDNDYEGLKEVHLVGYTKDEMDVLIELVDEKTTSFNA
jgi:O-acetyl-ADP-ribose deacetylase